MQREEEWREEISEGAAERKRKVGEGRKGGREEAEEAASA